MSTLYRDEKTNLVKILDDFIVKLNFSKNYVHKILLR